MLTKLALESYTPPSPPVSGQNASYQCPPPPRPTNNGPPPYEPPLGGGSGGNPNIGPVCTPPSVLRCSWYWQEGFGQAGSFNDVFLCHCA